MCTTIVYNHLQYSVDDILINLDKDLHKYGKSLIDVSEREQNLSTTICRIIEKLSKDSKGSVL